MFRFIFFKKCYGLRCNVRACNLYGSIALLVTLLRYILIYSCTYTCATQGTSALDTETEARLYRLLRDRCGSFVSVGHRMQLVQYHSHVLEARGEGRWRLVTAEQFEAEAEARGGLGSAKAQGGSPAKFKQAQAQHF